MLVYCLPALGGGSASPPVAARTGGLFQRTVARCSGGRECHILQLERRQRGSEAPGLTIESEVEAFSSRVHAVAPGLLERLPLESHVGLLDAIEL